MENELFAKVYIDEGISPVFGDYLRTKGFNVKNSAEERNNSLSDEEQLDFAISFKRVIITFDKSTFLVDSKAFSKKHYGILIVPKQFDENRAVSAAQKAIDNYFNVYTADEWENAVCYL